MRSILQTKAWAEFKSRHGWRYHELELSNGQSPLFVLERDLPLGKKLLYAPEASLENVTEQDLQKIANQLEDKGSDYIFFRLELFDRLGETTTQEGQRSLVAELTQAGYIKAFEEIQPEYRQWVDISGAESTILSHMKEKGRYNVRLAQRKGVTTRTSTDIKDVEVFYNLFKITAERDGFTIRTQAYFHDLCATLFDNKLGEMVIAEYEGEPLVALIITHYDGLAGYLYGASSSEKRNLMAPYAAHFAAMVAAKEKGCTTYDLIQIAPPDAEESHVFTSLTRFKQQFGGDRVALVGGWDFVYQPLWYQGFKAVEKFRRRH